MSAQRAPYGTWTSPITAESITGNSTSLDDVVVDRITSKVYHLEGRPSERGRTVLVDSESGRDVIGPEFNSATSVHEYGGAPAIVHDGIAYFSNKEDLRVYRVPVNGGQAEAVTPENPAHRFACFDIHPIHKHLLVAILEDHTNDKPSTVVNTLCLINVNTKTVTKGFVSGTDFYALPRFSPDGKRFAWQQWTHPDMPWEAAEIWVADVVVSDPSSEALQLQNPTHVAGEKGKISAGYPAWVTNDLLAFLSDESGFANPWKYSFATGKASPILPEPIADDFSAVLWTLNYFPFAVVQDGKAVVFTSWRDGRHVLSLVEIESGERREISDNPYVTIECVRTVSSTELAFVAGKPDEGKSIVKCSVSTSIKPEVKFTTLKADSTSKKFPKEIVSVARGIALKVPPTNAPLHVVYYPPHNNVYAGSSIEGEKPPCVVSAHGGPTGMAYQRLNWSIQYYTSRGFAWLDVNYGGSFGYGRAYRDRLVGQWGVVDHEDCITATKLMAEQGYIDPHRAVIRGGSAGGLTVLNSLRYSKVFAAGTSMYGVSDLLALAEETHKFESQYGFKLLGGTPEEIPRNYKDRSPIHFVNEFDTPLLILQGSIDRVVPKEQSESIYNGIKSRGGDVDYKCYEGEGHGFRQQQHQQDALERELAFYERVLGLKQAAQL